MDPLNTVRVRVVGGPSSAGGLVGRLNSHKFADCADLSAVKQGLEEAIGDGSFVDTPIRITDGSVNKF